MLMYGQLQKRTLQDEAAVKGGSLALSLSHCVDALWIFHCLMNVCVCIDENLRVALGAASILSIGQSAGLKSKLK